MDLARLHALATVENRLPLRDRRYTPTKRSSSYSPSANPGCREALTRLAEQGLDIVFQRLQQLPNARPEVEIAALARVMDTFFWSLLGQALGLSRAELNQCIDSATHLMYHAMFSDAPKTPQ